MRLDRKALAAKIGRTPVIGFTCSTFDLFHAGHVAMLQESKEQCDYLIVGLLSDPTISRPNVKNKPVQTMFERWLQVSSCSFVDEVVPFQTEEEICDIVLTLRPDIRIVGEEYIDKPFTGKDLCPIYYNSRRHSFSTTDLRERIIAANAAEPLKTGMPVGTSSAYDHGRKRIEDRLGAKNA